MPQYEKGLILRLGKYHATADSGLTFLTPLVDEMIKVDMREQVINVEPQKVITRDNVTVTVDAVIYYRVVDPVRAMFEVQNFGLAATTLAQTNLRNLIGDKTLDETLIARDMINTNLRAVLDEATNTWGVKVTRVEVQKIDPPVGHHRGDEPPDEGRAGQARHDPRVGGDAAERDPEGRGVQAGGDPARPRATRRRGSLRAEAEAKAIEMVSNAAEKFFQDRAALSKQLDVLQATLAQNTKYVIPGNADLVTVLGLDTQTAPSLVPVRRNIPRTEPRTGA